MKKFANNNNRNNNNNRSDRPRNKTFTFNVKDDITDRNGNPIDMDQVYGALSFLQDNEIFDILSIAVQMSKTDLFGDNYKGFANVGYIHKFDPKAKTVDVTVFGNFVEKIEDMQNIGQGPSCLMPKVIMDRDGDFARFANFDLV